MTRLVAAAKCAACLAVAAAATDPVITATATFAALRTLDRYHQEHTP